MIQFESKKILVIASHPDDELLGLGGTIHRFVHEQGGVAKAVILGEGITSRADERNPAQWSEELKTHRANIEAARKCIGYESVGTYDFPDNRFDSVPLLDIIKVIEKEKQTFQPDIIFTHHGGDVNVDHQRAYEAVITATRPMEHEKVASILTFETPSSTEWRFSSPNQQFVPNVFISISEENLQAKIQGMECYKYEKRRYPHPRSPEALKNLAQRWGVVVGKPYAEAFHLVRSIL